MTAVSAGTGAPMSSPSQTPVPNCPGPLRASLAMLVVALAAFAAYEKKGDLDRAQQDLARAVELDGEDEEYKQALARTRERVTE